jgi:hypothetical protein
VFDGLFNGEDNDDVLQLLFVFAHWHGLAKLRMHTDQTLALFDEATSLLGVKFQRFVNHTCRKFNTCELQHEANARSRRAAKKSTTSLAAPPGQAEKPRQVAEIPTLAVVQAITLECHPPPTPTPLPGMQQTTTGPSTEHLMDLGGEPTAFSPPVATSPTEPVVITARKAKTFNLDTYKYHSLGDYTEHIRQYGTTDSYSTEPVCYSLFIKFDTG